MNLKCYSMKVFDENEMEKIYESAINVWKKVPLRAPAPDEFYEVMRNYGCKIDGEKIYFTDSVINKVLTRIEEEKKKNIQVRSDNFSQEITYSVSGQAHCCHDAKTGELRSATEKDLADFSRLVDMFPGLGRAHPTFIPQNVPVGSSDLHAFATGILNSSKPCPVSVYSEKMLPYFAEVQAVVQGSMEEVKKQPLFFAKLWWNSPFMITEENIRIALKARELLGQPINVLTMAVAGISAPVTLSGVLVLNTAEILMCNTITLAFDNRLIGYCANPLTFDMKIGIHNQAGPDVELIRLGSAQIGTYIFGTRYRIISGFGTAAKIPGAQSMMEKSLGVMWGFLSGTRNFSAMGTLSFSDIGSAVQLMLDLEIVSYFKRLIKGIEVNEEKIAEELICEIAPKGAKFLDTEHTFKYFKEELWSGELIDRRVFGSWIKEPKEMVDKAKEKALKLMKESPNRCPLSEKQKEEIKKIVGRADKEVS